MDQVWESPKARFWRRLLNENIDKFLNDPEKRILRHMRYDHKMAKEYQRLFGAILKERGLDLDTLIGEAYGEDWDLGKYVSQDEEKVAHSQQRNHETHDDLDRARKGGLCEGQGGRHVLQGGPESSGQDLEEEGQRRQQGVKEV